MEDDSPYVPTKGGKPSGNFLLFKLLPLKLRRQKENPKTITPSPSEKRPFELSKAVSLEENHYKKVGFYFAIETGQNYSDLEKRIEEDKEEAKSSFINYIQERLTALNRQIAVIQEEIEAKKILISGYMSSLGLLRNEKDVLLSDIQKLKSYLAEQLTSFLVQKKAFIDGRVAERIDRIQGQLRSLINNVNLAWDALEERDVDAQKTLQDGWNQFKDYLEKQAAEKKALLESLNERLSRLIEIHINNRVISIMGLAALSAITSTGWFFSVFAQQSKYGSSDKVSFVIELLFQFGKEVFQPALGLGTALLYLLVACLIMAAILALLTILFRWADHWINIMKSENQRFIKSMQERSEESLSVEEREMGSPFSSSDLKQGYASVIWMKNLPYVVLLILASILGMFLIGFSGYDDDKLTDLTNAVSGQTIGATIAIAMGGILFIYVNYIVEHRLKSDKELSLKSFWELMFAIVVVVLGFITTLSYEVFGLSPDAKIIERTSFVLFAIMTLASGLIIAYFAKFSSYYYAVKETELAIHRLESLLLFYAKVRNFKPWKLIPRKEFIRAFKEVNYDVFDLIAAENDETKVVLNGQTPGNKRKSIRDIWKNTAERVRNWRPKFSIFSVQRTPEGPTQNRPKKKENDRIEIPVSANSKELHFDSHIAKEYFTDLYYQIRDTLNTIHDKQDRIKVIDKELESVRHGELPVSINTLMREKTDLESEIVTFEEQVIENQELIYVFNSDHQVAYKQIWLDMTEGYELGKWYLEFRKTN